MSSFLLADTPPASWWHVLDPRVSLRALAALVAGGGALGLVLVLASGGSTLLQRQIERQLAPSFETLAAQIVDKLDRTLYERYRQIQFTASLPPFRDVDASTADRQAAIQALHDASPDFAWVGFADGAGTVRAAYPHVFEGDNATDLPWFRGARRQAYVGNVRLFPALAHDHPGDDPEPPRFLDVAVPVAARNGQMIGVLATQLRWALAREIQLSVVPEGARREHLGVTIYSASGEVLLDSGGSGWTEPPEVPRGLPNKPGARGRLVEPAPGGTVYLTGYARLSTTRDYRGQGWLAVVRQPVEDAFAPVFQLRNRVLQLGLVLAVLLTGVGWWIASRIERRFRAIARAAGRIGDGDILTLMPMPRGGSDLARMCSALGDMVAKFRMRQEALEAENARLAAHTKSAHKP